MPLGYTEPVLEPHVRERLTGAVVLVALVVLLVPELFTGSRRVHAPLLEAASEAGPTRSYTIELGADEGRRLPTATSPPVATAGEAVPTAAVPAPAAPVQAPPAAAPTPPESGQAVQPVREESPVQVGRVGGASRGWSVQIGSFSSQANAERLLRELGSKGFEAHIVPPAGKGRALYKVRVGSASSRADAQTLGARLRASGYDGTVVAPP